MLTLNCGPRISSAVLFKFHLRQSCLNSIGAITSIFQIIMEKFREMSHGLASVIPLPLYPLGRFTPLFQGSAIGADYIADPAKIGVWVWPYVEITGNMEKSVNDHLNQKGKFTHF